MQLKFLLEPKKTKTLGSETPTDIRSIIREEIQSALTQDRKDGDSLHNETWNKSVNYVGTASGLNRKRGRGYRPRGRGRSSRDSRDNLKNAEPRCYHCNLPGHFRRQCQFKDCCQQMDSSLASIATEMQKNPDHYNKTSGPQHHKEHFKLSKDGVVLRASKNNHWKIVVPSSLLLQVLQLGHDN